MNAAMVSQRHRERERERERSERFVRKSGSGKAKKYEKRTKATNIIREKPDPLSDAVLHVTH